MHGTRALTVSKIMCQLTQVIATQKPTNMVNRALFEDINLKHPIVKETEVVSIC